ncbi:MAG: GNAT family protein [Bacteroidota bacterium]
MPSVFPFSLILSTPRFHLRIPSESDFPRIFSATRHPGFNDGMLWEPPESMAELEAPLRRSHAAWEAGRKYDFSIVPTGEDVLLGRISIRKMEGPGVWDIGFWTHPEAQGQGVMSECVAEVLRFGFEQLAATRIEACHAVWNKASERVLHKNGFQFVRHLPQGFQKRGEWVEENELAIERADWLARLAASE